MKKYTTSELQTKFKDLLKDNDSLLCTEDGQAFYNTPQGKNYANAHATKVKVKVLEIKKKKNDK